VPAINMGVVYVVDTSNDRIREIPDFATNEIEFGGRKRRQGPSGVSVGDGVVYIGDRADSSICSIDAKTVARKTCGHIDSVPDGVVYVAPTGEVWVTAPRDNSVRILDSQSLTQKEKLIFEGRPEGYAVDAKRGRFYMNYEDKDLTTAIDLKTHKTLAKWPEGVARMVLTAFRSIRIPASFSLLAALGRRFWMQATTERSCHPLIPGTAWTTLRSPQLLTHSM
jgi:DNA-binding beta-propeller fold protein YncE